jgi:hypothetical protein
VRACQHAARRCSHYAGPPRQLLRWCQKVLLSDARRAPALRCCQAPAR